MHGPAAPPEHPSARVLLASLIGTVIEWYDLFVYGTLVFVLSTVFFPQVLGIPPLVLSLIAFVAGAAVRPLGGAVFGRFGDMIGRRFAFVLSTLTMGIGSVAIGLLPTYAAIGLAAPIALVSLRVLQGLALGGEYGGGVTFIAENIRDRRRGLWTGVLQSASTLGLLLATAAVLATLALLGPASLRAWGWRVPFLGAVPLLAVALFVRWRLVETPLFQRLRELKRTSRMPLRETLRSPDTQRRIAIGMAVVGGGSIVWHTGQFYTQIFLQSSRHLPLTPTLEAMAVALAFAAPFYFLFGALSDRVGRLRLILLGTIGGAVATYPAFVLLAVFSSPANLPGLAVVLWGLLTLGALCYAPMGAYLVESFPARVRYTSVSLVHGIGTGDIGDATLLVAPVLALTLLGLYAGLLWSVLVPLALASVGLFALREERAVELWAEVEAPLVRSSESVDP
jgi:MFS family permease